MAKDLIKTNIIEKEKEEVKEKWFQLSQEFKRKWLYNIGSTLLLVGILLAIYIGLNWVVKKYFRAYYIDFSADQIFSLDQSIKDDIADIPNEVELICVNFTEEDDIYKMTEMFAQANNKISTRIFDEENDLALLTDTTNVANFYGVIVKSADKTSYVYASDMYTEDENFNTVSVADQRLCSAIRNVSSLDKPVVYFGTGYSNQNSYKNLISFIENELIEVKSFSLNEATEVPEDCKLLILQSPTLSDYSDQTVNALNDYVQKAGNIIYLQSIPDEDVFFPNVTKFLEQYGIQSFVSGVIAETSSEYKWQGSTIGTTFYAPIEETIFTQGISGQPMLLVTNSCKINSIEFIAESDITQVPLVYTSATARLARPDGRVDETGSYLIGNLTDLVVSRENPVHPTTSSLVVFTSDLFCSDLEIAYQTPIIQYANNKQFMLNLVGYLVDREPTATSTFKTLYNKYTLTNKQISNLRTFTYMCPIVIVIVGINIWYYRRCL